MLTLFHCRDARSFRALWMLEELRLDYRLELLRFPPRAREKHYLELNPLGTVPLLVDGDVRMTESAAICHYLATVHAGGEGAVSVGEPQYGAYLNALFFGEATLTFPQTLVLRYSQIEPEDRRQPQVVEDYARWFASRLRGLEPLIDGSGYLCAGRFTAADVSVGYALMLAELLGLDSHFSESVTVYWRSLGARDGFLRAKAAQARPSVSQSAS
jgi:glutathione S-transferase